MRESNWIREEMAPKLERFLEPLLKAARLDVTFQIGGDSPGDPAFEQPEVTVRFAGRDQEVLLANKAQLLLALEHIALEALRVRSEDHSRVLFDANDYRALRIEELRLSAETAAERVRRTGVPFKFGPMNSRERRTIHVALSNDSAVRTESEGLTPQRGVVVYPAAQAPATAQKNFVRR